MSKIKVDIISGFLGAGKTTIIKKLVGEALKGEKVVIIENEFGEISVDGDFLRDSGIEIKEINAGCICCSLVGDFTTSLKEMIDTYSPERIIIEPSGVGKLSDVIKSVKDLEMDNVEVNSTIAIVDAGKAKMYHRNFGEFFDNQIKCAAIVLLSRTQNVDDNKIMDAAEIIHELNPYAKIVMNNWENVDASGIVEKMDESAKMVDLLVDVMEHPEHEYHDHGDGNLHFHADEEAHDHGDCCHEGHDHGHDHGDCCHEGHDHGHDHGDCCHEGHDHGHDHGDCCHEGHDHGHDHGDCCHEGHDHGHDHGDCCHEGHDHDHDHGDCCHEGHDHSYDHGDCCHEGHDHNHDHGDCCHEGHDHNHDHGDCCHEGHDHGHDHGDCCHEGHDHGHDHGDCCHEGHDHNHDHIHHGHSHEEVCECGSHDQGHNHNHGDSCGCGGHDHEGHGDSCACGHDHAADEVFESWGVEAVANTYNKDQLEAILEKLANDTDYGIVVRAKGIVVDSEGNWRQFDLTPGEYEIREGSGEHNSKLVVVGSQLITEKIKELFGV